jgi:hypothetical protein
MNASRRNLGGVNRLPLSVLQLATWARSTLGPACKLALLILLRAAVFVSTAVLYRHNSIGLGSGKVLLSSLGILQSEIVWQASDTQ